MKALLLFLLSTAAWATSVTVPISVTVTDQNCQSWNINGTTITCTGSGPTPPPPGGWPPACASKSLDMPWSVSPKRYVPSDYGGFAPDDVLVIRIVPTNTTTSMTLVSGAEYQSSPSSRIWTLSPTPCDFTAQPTRGAYNLVGSNSITSYFTVGQTASNSGYYPQVAVNQPIYLNIKNAAGATCFSTGQCDLFADFRRPNTP